MGIQQLPRYTDIGTQPFYIKKISAIREVPESVNTWYAYLKIQLKETGKEGIVFYVCDSEYAAFLTDLSQYLPSHSVRFTSDGLLNFSH